MGPFAIATLLSLASGGLQMWGQASQGAAQREQAKLQTQRSAQQARWQKDQITYQQEDLNRQKGASMGTLLTNSAALGIGGATVSSQKGFMVDDYNRVFSQMENQKSQIDTQVGWGREDLGSYLKQSKTNQFLGMTGSLLGTAGNIYGQGLSMNVFGSGKMDNRGNIVENSWINRKDRSFKSLWHWGE